MINNDYIIKGWIIENDDYEIHSLAMTKNGNFYFIKDDAMQLALRSITDFYANRTKDYSNRYVISKMKIKETDMKGKIINRSKGEDFIQPMWIEKVEDITPYLHIII